ncbi:MAG: hypothetical protein CME26_10000 [Gemmatimonadetes bacterium]|nr:hypothetical protein [Gemmatimonadota bacterium]
MAAPAGTSVFYDRDVQAVFDRSCTGGCHEPGGIGVIDSGLDLTPTAAYDSLFDPTLSRNGPQAVVEDPDNSLLVWKLEGVDPTGRGVSVPVCLWSDPRSPCPKSRPSGRGSRRAL